MNEPVPTPSLYDRIGGETALAAFVVRFYEAMETDPEVARIWRMHPGDMGEMKVKLVAFLSGFVGGPELYSEMFGPPFMRARHLHLPIGSEERDMWMKCARMALDHSVADPDARAEFGAKLEAFAGHMRNRGDGGAAGATPADAGR